MRSLPKDSRPTRPPHRPTPDRAAAPNNRLQKTCSTACSNINLASWPLCMTSASPLTTTRAERDVRMIKVQQKVSGAFRTLEGADTFCAIRSYISTARKHGLNAIDAIYNAFLDQPFIPSTNQA